MLVMWHSPKRSYQFNLFGLHYTLGGPNPEFEVSIGAKDSAKGS